ncbi:FAST kinase domain-containing protein 1, mitochondrial-like [Diadema setosum]|uniref:FAST kinase domain-containing protein 1, mitochondrial-like n=1 Tax=Diadema setosum TaxID=31175 RepID=UPI003B3AC4EA
MSLLHICARCSKKLQRFISAMTLRPNIMLHDQIQQALFFTASSCRNLPNIAGVQVLSSTLLVSKVDKMAQKTKTRDQCQSAAHTSNIFLNSDFESSPSCVEFGDSLEVEHILSLIGRHLEEFTPQDVATSINRLWECIWHFRSDVDLWLKYLETLQHHELLPQLCEKICLHAHSMTNAEALNTLYLVLKFGAPGVTSEAISALYASCARRVRTFDLNDAAMFIRCAQSVKDILDVYSINCEEGSAIIRNVIAHTKDLLGHADDEPDSGAMCRLLLGLLHCSVDATEPLVATITQKLYHGIPELNTSKLAPLSKAVFLLGKHQSPFAGRMMHRFAELLDDFASPSDFSHMFYTLANLSSKDMERRLTETFHTLFVEGASFGFNDLRRIIQGSLLLRDRVCKESILQKSGQLLLPQIPAISPIELAIIYGSLRRVYLQDYHLRGLLEEQVEKHFQVAEAPHQLLALIEVLSHDPPPDLKPQIIKKAIQIVPYLSNERLGRLCNAVGRMKIRSGHLPTVIEAHVLENIGSITDLVAIKNVSHFLMSSKTTNVELKNIFIEKLHRKLRDAITPNVLVFALDALSNMGISAKDIDPRVWEQVLVMMPKLTGNDLRRVFFVLTGFSNNLSPKSPDDPVGLQVLLNYVRRSVFATESAYLSLSADDSCPRNDEEMPHSLPELDPSRIRDAPTAVAFAKLLIQHRIYNKPFLTAIESTVWSAMADLSPFHVSDILEVFVIGNFQPSGEEKFLEELCDSRVLPYMADLGPSRLIGIALRFAALQYFPMQLLSTIFSIDFLRTMEKTYVSRNLSSQLQDLNRIVCLDFPELRVPWFSQQVAHKAGRSPLHYLKLDVESVLVDILGGPSFLRKNAVTPYAYTIDFECLLDSSGNPVEYINHSSLGSRVSRQDEVGAVQHSSKMVTPDTGSLPGVHRVAIDIIRPTDLCSNITRVSSWVEMKRRHLEMLGYEYTTIPYTDWSRDLLSTFQAKRLYLSDLVGGNLPLLVAETEEDAKAARRKPRRNEDMVDRMLEDWGEMEDDKSNSIAIIITINVTPAFSNIVAKASKAVKSSFREVTCPRD